MTQKTINKQIEELHRSNVVRGLDRLKNQFERMIDEIDRETKNIDKVGSASFGEDDGLSYGMIVSNISHALIWNMADASFDGLIIDATSADIARIKNLHHLDEQDNK